MLCSMNTVSVVTTSVPSSIHLQSDKTSISSKSSKFGLDETSKPCRSITSQPSIQSVLGDWIWGGHTDLEEDNALLFNTPVGFKPDNIAERRKYFQNKANRVATTYKTDRIYNLEVITQQNDMI